MKPFFTVACLLLLTNVFPAFGDLCLILDSDKDDSDSTLAPYIHKGATPKAGRNAGLYSWGLLDGKNASSLTECLLSCCDTASCNVLLFHDNKCYLISCNQTSNDSCSPVYHKDNPMYSDTFLISVRTLQETALLHNADTSSTIPPPDKSPPAPKGPGSGVTAECSTETNEGCGLNEACRLMLGEDDDVRILYVCECQHGYARDVDTDRCTVRSTNIACEYGIDRQCLANEECTVKSSRSRGGQCLCVEGYQRDDVTGICAQVGGTTPKADKSNLETAATSKPESSIQNEETKPKDPETKKSGTDAGTDKSPATSTTKTLPAPAPSTARPPLAPLVVSAGENREITLPTNDVSLNAFVIPNDENDSYQYMWQLVQEPDHEGDNVGEMVGMDTNSLKLSKLISGLYTFKVVVTAEGKYGEAYVNITVNPPARINSPPIAVIKPPNQSVTLPNDVILDGSESTDDDKVVQYHWEQVSGPVEAPGINEQDMDKSTLMLKGLKAGLYKFKLTVTDSDAVQNVTFANVTVIKETDYPPRANAGSNVIINLPQNSVTLSGNASTDDQGIVSYEWINKNNKNTADMKGVRTANLELKNLEQGDYTFTLKVTDTAGQVATADVRVFVKAEHNKPPVPNPGQNKTVWLPQNIVTLDASNSTDDQKIDSYKWTQISGPSSVIIENADRAVATASNLVVGVYKFKVTVTDVEKLQASRVVYITVKQDDNKPPVARAGGAQVVTLPVALVAVNGNASTDDRGIMSWLWTRADNSLAAGEIVTDSDHQAVLQLTDLVAGRYIFTLTVTDEEGLSSSDTATLTVNSAPNKDDLVELRLKTDIRAFTQANKKNLQSQIALLLHKNMPHTDVNIEELTEDMGSRNLIVLFYVSRKIGSATSEVVPGRFVASTLRNRLWSDNSLLDFAAVSVETVVCQNNCSDHGMCDQSTKKCICEAFWMENPFRAYLDGNSNCQWSILYVIIIAFITVVTMIGVIWGLVFLCRRWYWTRPKKRHRYTLLDEVDEGEADKDNMELMQKGKLGKIQNSSLMVSESDFTSDEETLFINKKANGHVGKNGFVRPGKTKVKA